MKEVSYVHTEAYAAGELKHGTISLIEDGTLVIGILTQNHLYEKTVSNMVECKSRGAYLMGLTTYGHYNIEDTADFTVYIPKTDPHFATSLAIIPLQRHAPSASASRVHSSGYRAMNGVSPEVIQRCSASEAASFGSALRMVSTRPSGRG